MLFISQAFDRAKLTRGNDKSLPILGDAGDRMDFPHIDGGDVMFRFGFRRNRSIFETDGKHEFSVEDQFDFFDFALRQTMSKNGDGFLAFALPVA